MATNQPEDYLPTYPELLTLLVGAEAAFCETMSSMAKFAGTAMKLKTTAEINLLKHPFHFPPDMRCLRLPGYLMPHIECSIPHFNPEVVARDILQLPTDAFQKEAIVDWCDGYVQSLLYSIATDIRDDLLQRRQQASAFLVMWLEPMADVRGPTCTISKAVNDFAKWGKTDFMEKRRDYWKLRTEEPRTERYCARLSPCQKLAKAAELYANETLGLKDSLRALISKIDFLLMHHPALTDKPIERKTDRPRQEDGAESVEWLLTSPERLPERLRSLVNAMLGVALAGHMKLLKQMRKSNKSL